MRRLLLSAIVIGLVLSTAPSVLAATPQRDTWDLSYALGPTQFCGFAVDVHDYGWNAYNKVGEDGWTWSKTWQGTRDYMNPATDRTAKMIWSWRTSQTVASHTDSTLSLLGVTNGSIRVSGPSGAVVARDAGQWAFQTDFVWTGTDWQATGGAPAWWHGPQPMNLTDAFCEAMTALLDP